MRGYFGIGIEHVKTEENVGTLWRSAKILGASFIFTIGRRYKTQSSDTTATPRHVPLYHYQSIDEFYSHLPYDCRVVGVELTDHARDITTFAHPDRCIYLLGAEDRGLSKDAMAKCHSMVKIPGSPSLNVATAGSIVMYDRYFKRKK